LLTEPSEPAIYSNIGSILPGKNSSVRQIPPATCLELLQLILLYLTPGNKFKIIQNSGFFTPELSDNPQKTAKIFSHELIFEYVAG
jgi:hypothetical protein